MNDKVLHVCERGSTTMVRCKGAHGPQDLMLPCVRWSVAWPLRVGCAMGRGSSDVARTAPVTPGDRVPPSQHLPGSSQGAQLEVDTFDTPFDAIQQR